MTSGPVPGKVVSHIPGKAEDGDGEKWIVEYEGGAREAVSPQELLDILVAKQKPAAKPKTKAAPKPKKPKQPDQYISRSVESWMDLPDGTEAKVKGTIKSVEVKKSGKKAGKYYTVEWSHPGHTIASEKIHLSEIKEMLI